MKNCIYLSVDQLNALKIFKIRNTRGWNTTNDFPELTEILQTVVSYSGFSFYIWDTLQSRCFSKIIGLKGKCLSILKWFSIKSKKTSFSFVDIAIPVRINPCAGLTV